MQQKQPDHNIHAGLYFDRSHLSRVPPPSQDGAFVHEYQMDKSSPVVPQLSPAVAHEARRNSGEPAVAALMDALVALRVDNGCMDDTGIATLIERIGLLNIAGVGCPDGAAAFDLRDLLAALPDAADDDDLTEMVIKWLDNIFATCADDDCADVDDAEGCLDMADGEADELPANPSPRMEDLQPKTIRQDLTCDPKEVFPPPPLEEPDSASDSTSDSESECSTPTASDDDSVATVYSPSIVNFEFRRFDLKRRYGDSDLESSASEDEAPAKHRRRAAMPRRAPKPQRKFVRRATSPPSSDGESYFSDSVHMARPMSPIDGQIASHLATYCTLRSP